MSTQSVDIIDYPAARPAGGCLLASLDPTKREDLDALVVELRRLLSGMQHGSVTLIVQDGHVVQLDATHKVRLAGSSAPRRTGQPRPAERNSAVQQ
ncbi:MAG: YezD family protein [Chloroflexota bacterium]